MKRASIVPRTGIGDFNIVYYHAKLIFIVSNVKPIGWHFHVQEAREEFLSRHRPDSSNINKYSTRHVNPPTTGNYSFRTQCRSPRGTSNPRHKTVYLTN